MRKRKVRRKTHLCPNCETVLERNENYCHVCGQENHNLNAPMKDLIMEFIGGITFFETKFIETVKIIFTHPGKLTLAFNSGKRVKYMHPVRMYFGVSAIFFFIMSSDLLKKDSNTQLQSKNTIDSLRKAENRDYNSGRNFARQLKKDLSQNLESELDTVSKSNLDEFRKGMKDAQKEYNARKDSSKFYLGLFKKLIIPKDSITYYFQLNDEALDSVLTAKGISTFFPVRKTIKNSIVKEYHRYLEEKYGVKSEINGRTMLFNNYLPTIMFILLPFAAYILWFFEKRTKWRYYFQHLVFTLYTHSAIFVFWAICEFLIDLYKYFFNQDYYDYSGYIVLFVVILSLVYFMISIKNVYQQSWVKTLIKFILLTMSYSFLFILIILIGIFSGLVTT
ncbi:MAG: DUF3667 domain-containing protein [Flectobacillus sp.]|uniref:DUF3667 domain-containing protein n=1 Tax=Flectobacillus sp. TaxID=50419 RepID=UPI003B9ABCD2